MELLWLYKENYLKQVGRDLGFPIVENTDIIKKELSDNSNQKYIQEIELTNPDHPFNIING